MWRRFSIALIGLLIGSVAVGQDTIDPSELPWGSLRTLSQSKLPEATGPDLSSIPTVTGRVLDPDGKPVSRAKIEAVWRDESSQVECPLPEDCTSQLGLRVLSDLPKGNITCRVSKRGYESQKLLLPSPLEEHLVQLRKLPAGE